MRFAFFGSSLVSAYWNGAATYYRGLLRALAERGHRITFFEPDAFDRQRHRDITDPEWAEVIVYPASEDGASRALERARGADFVIKASGVGVLDEFLEREVVALRSPDTAAIFWDVDAPATIERLRGDPDDALHPLLSRFDHVFTYGGGDPVVRGYRALGAQGCVPIYNAVDPRDHHPAPPDTRFESTLGFLGNRLPDREARVDDLFFGAAREILDRRFVLGGSGWQSKLLPANVRWVGHVYTRDHNAFNASPRAVLNINRDSMARFGFSPATRVFEAAGAGACIITDAFAGIEQFFEPENEILVAASGIEVAERVRDLGREEAVRIGAGARRRALAEHTYAHRALDVERALGMGAVGPKRCMHTSQSPDSAAERCMHTSQSAVSAPVRCIHTSSRPAPRAGWRIAIFGLSITSSWGNGHATTHRSLSSALVDRGHEVTFFERDMPWYAAHRDHVRGPAGIELYDSVADAVRRFSAFVRDADLVIVGSYVPDGRELCAWVLSEARGVTAFYDIDTPVTLAALETGQCEYLSATAAARFDLYLSFTGGPILGVLENDVGVQRARPLYCSADPASYVPAVRSPAWDLGYMGTYSADRQPALERLMLDPARRDPSLACSVVGPLYPEEIAWPPNVERKDHIGPAEHAEYYSRLRFALNLTRADMARWGYAPSVRLFEAAACATPIITDPWPGIATVLAPGREVIVAETADDVLRAVKGMSDDERRMLGRRARARVLSEHTPGHRAEALASYVREVLERVPARQGLR